MFLWLESTTFCYSFSHTLTDQGDKARDVISERFASRFQAEIAYANVSDKILN